MSNKYDDVQRFIDLQMGEDWLDNHPDPWSAAEAWIMEFPVEALAALRVDIVRLLADCGSPEACWDQFRPAQFRRDLGGFSAWLRDVQHRIERVLAGHLDGPLEEPRPYRF